MVSTTARYEFGDFTLDVGQQRLSRRETGETIPLTGKVFDTLVYLVERAEQTLDRDVLLGAIWPGVIVEENSLSQNISTLRQVLGEVRGENRYILTIPRKGYRFVAKVRQIDELAAATTSDLPAAPLAAHVPLRWKRVVWIGAAVLVVAIAAVALSFVSTRAPRAMPAGGHPLAILPFKPLVPAERNESLELGMTESLIANLGQQGARAIAPLSSVRRYASLDQDALIAGRELGVESVLDGSLQRAADRIRLTARLINVVDGASLWVGTFDEKATDVFAVQDAISERVAGALAVPLSNEERQHLTKRYTENIEAYDLYLKGRYYWNKLIPPEVRRSIQFFQQAIDLDPTYALAYAGIAEAYRSLPISSDVPPDDAFPLAHAAAAKALEIDEMLADVHATLSILNSWYDWDWESAEREAKRAITLNPNSSEAHRANALLLSALGRQKEAIVAAARARELDPLALLTRTHEALFLYYDGRYEEAREKLIKTLEIDPNFWIALLTLAKIYIRQGQYGDALAELNRARISSGGNTQTISLIGYASAQSGDRAQALTMLDELKDLSRQRYVPPYCIAMIHHGLGEDELTLDWLERAHKVRDVLLSAFITVDPSWDRLRTTPRFVRILKGMNLE